MNTYRAMGVTGYLFTNDSATEKLPRGTFSVGKASISHKKKAGGRSACRPVHVIWSNY
jgi:hypothetical protein